MNDLAAKAALRAEVRARRAALSPERRAAASAGIATATMALLTRLRPRVLAGYSAMAGEVDPAATLEWASGSGITCALPVVKDATTMVFRRYRHGDALERGAFGTLSPLADAPEVTPDILLVPLVAFDRTGARLGQGGGFYDRGMAMLHASGYTTVRIGLAFATQEVESVPHAPHDIRMDWIVTEAMTLEIGAEEREQE